MINKILSESYFQHSDHFIRVLNEKEKNQGISRSEKAKLDDKISIEEKSKETDNNIVDKKIATS